MSDRETDRYVKLSETPALNHPGSPSCDACWVDTEHDGDNWVCPSCGTAWPGDILEDDGEKGSLFEEWSGETLTGLTCPNDDAYRVSGQDPQEREKLLAEILGQGGDDE